MSVVATVTPGQVYTADGDGTVLQTKAKLNALGTPTVTVDLTDSIVAGDLAVGAVLAKNLEAALQAIIPKLSLTGTNDADNTGSVSIQVQNANGLSLSQRFLMRVWISSSDFGNPVAQTDFSVTTGSQQQELTADAYYEVISDSNGVVAMNIDAGSAKTVYVMAEINGRIYSVSIAITSTS